MFKRWLNIDTNKSALIIGPRRSGKTTYLTTKFPTYRYITLDDMDYYTWAKSDPKGLITHAGDKVIIDEIQRVPSLTIAIKYAIDSSSSHFLLTGSSTIGLLDSSSESLAGRINMYSMPTACWGENVTKPIKTILEPFPTPLFEKQAQRLWEEALYYGLFPEVITTTSKEGKKNY